MSVVTKRDKIQHQVQEYLKCKNDFEYFCNNYIYLELAGGDALFYPYKKQKEFIDLLATENNVVCLKSRQIGLSTTVQAYSTYLLNFFDNTVIGIISKDGKEATDFARAIRGMLEKLPIWLKPRGGRVDSGSFEKKAEQSFILANGSKLHVATVNPKAPNKTLRGKAITFLIIDEAAFISKLDDAFTALVPAMASVRKQAQKMNVPFGCAVISTPNKTMGPGAWFFSRYTKALAGEGIFKPFTIHWKEIPELANDPDWYTTQCEMFDNDPRKIEQELELKFLPSSGSFFDEKVCVYLQDISIEPVEVNKLFTGEIQVFEKARPGRFYIIGVDTAPEFGEDKSAITVWDYETMDQVCEYHVKCKVLDFVKVVKFMCAQYSGLLVVESNSYGNQVIEQINDSDYSTMLYKETRGNKVYPGLSNNVKTRPLMIDALYSYITQYPNIVKSKKLAFELIGLVENNGKVEADTGCHDDLALSASFCFYVRKYDPPLMLDVKKFDNSIFDQVVSMNYEDYHPSTFRKPDKTQFNLNDDELFNLNSQMMKRIKDSSFLTPDDSYVDILDFYKD